MAHWEDYKAISDLEKVGVAQRMVDEVKSDRFKAKTLACFCELKDDWSSKDFVSCILRRPPEK